MKVYLLLSILSFILPVLMGCASSIGPFSQGPLRSCPDSPNCVSSVDERPKHHVAPLAFQGDWQAARQRLLELLPRMTRTQVKEVGERYLRAECRSRIFGFIDDVEFYFEPDQSVIQIRSASRVGYSDLGVNRKRVEAIRALWEGMRSQGTTSAALPGT